MVRLWVWRPTRSAFHAITSLSASSVEQRQLSAHAFGVPDRASIDRQGYPGRKLPSTADTRSRAERFQIRPLEVSGGPVLSSLCGQDPFVRDDGKFVR
jgi:hypothetical protein